MTAVCEKYVHANLVKSETLPIFVMRDSDNRIAKNIFYTTNRRVPVILPFRWSLSRKQKGARLLFVHTQLTFDLKMRDSEKVSAGAQGASIATVSARNSAFSKLVQAHSTKRYYQVSIYAKRIDICVANLHCSHPFLATSREEAIGMACARIKERWPKYFILAEDIVCQPLNLK